MGVVQFTKSGMFFLEDTSFTKNKHKNGVFYQVLNKLIENKFQIVLQDDL